MWNPEKLALVSPEALQKRLPFAISIEEISNFIGNLSLAPNALPTTNRTKYVLHALIKELLILENLEIREPKWYIPESIERICANTTECCLIALDGLILPDKCSIANKNNELVATKIQIHPEKSEISGEIILDFGLNDKQILDLKPQTIIHIPTPQTQKLTIQIHIEKGSTTCETDTKCEIEIAQIGLIIDTREKDILAKSNLNQAKQLTIEWLQSLDIPTSGI